jgi:hypothetical protein
MKPFQRRQPTRPQKLAEHVADLDEGDDGITIPEMSHRAINDRAAKRLLADIFGVPPPADRTSNS